VHFTKGRIIIPGKLVSRGKDRFADYIYYKPNIPIALIEAKDNNHPVGGGMRQGLEYAETLDIPFVFSSAGDGFVLIGRGRVAPRSLISPSMSSLVRRHSVRGIGPGGNSYLMKSRSSSKIILTTAAERNLATTSASP
jgi:type I restriction enzyme R subunit